MVMHYYKEHHHPSSISDVEEFQFAPSRSHLRRRSSVAFSLLTTVFIGLLVLFLLNSYSKPIVSSRLVIHIMDNYTGRNCQLVLDTKMRNAKWITTRGQLLYATHFFPHFIPIPFVLRTICPNEKYPQTQNGWFCEITRPERRGMYHFREITVLK